MLTLTENAVMVIRDLAAQQGNPQVAGVRISADDGMDSFVIEAVPEPEPGDQVIEDLGARAFLDAEAAQTLDDKALDAGIDDQGEVEFAILERPR
ncbi:MAG TPA: adhesin [Micromonosporaceae bacterium]|nr:adhesin [Micromonosporaceae bacterium]